MRDRWAIAVSLLALFLLPAAVGPAIAQTAAPNSPDAPLAPTGTGFTYQGQLKRDGQAVNATCQMAFRLYDAPSAGNLVGGPLTQAVAVDGGLFTAGLDFGPAFQGDARWLGIQVQCPGDAAYVDLGRQPLTAAPYALYALKAPWSGLAGVPAGFADGIDNGSNGTDHNHWGQSWSGSGTGLTLSGGAIGLNATGSTSGVQGYAGAASGSGVLGSGYIGVQGSSSTSGRGVVGDATAGSGTTYGVYGESSSPAGTGVYGWAPAATGSTIGVKGVSASTSGIGVHGEAQAASGINVGVYGLSKSPNGVGAYGDADATSGVTLGVYGRSKSPEGRGVYGLATASSGGTYGVYGESNSTGGTGVFGKAILGGSDLFSATYGVHGWADGPLSTGVYGEGGAAGVKGTGALVGVQGRSSHQSSAGVEGIAEAASGQNNGVYGLSYSPDGTGVRGSSPNKGVFGEATAISGHTVGVSGLSVSTSGQGVVGDATANTGTTYGVIGYSASPAGYAGYFRNTSSGPALWALTDSGTGNIIEVRSSFSDIEFRVERGGNAYADGAFTGGGADYAELLPGAPGLEPGDVLVIDPEGRLARSSEPYQVSVAGVYSTQPGFLAGAGDEAIDLSDRVPLAVMGVVPVKASAEGGPIRPGDLLTGAGTPGHAMRAGADPPPGTVIGKALQPLAAGRGMIEMLVMLR